MSKPEPKRWSHPALTFAALAVVVALAWVYLLFVVHPEIETMDTGAGQMMAMSHAWSRNHFVMTFSMWAMMMVAMMLPSSVKVVLHAAALVRHLPTLLAARHIGEFVAGYLAVWLGFSLVATTAQWGLDESRLLSGTIATSDPMLAGSILVYAGVYEGTDLKQVCLTRCRAPEEFLARYWPDRPFLTGLWHGLFCLGCCWMLMTLLFVGGVMNLAWIAAIALLVLGEKTLPRGTWFRPVIAVVLVVWGAVRLSNLG